MTAFRRGDKWASKFVLNGRQLWTPGSPWETKRQALEAERRYRDRLNARRSEETCASFADRWLEEWPRPRPACPWQRGAGTLILSKPIRKQILASRRWHRRFWLHRMTGIPMRRLRERDREFQRQLDLSEEVESYRRRALAHQRVPASEEER